LYADIAAVSASAMDQLEDQRRPEKARAYRNALAVNLVLNGSWTWLFFGRRKLGASAVAAAALTASSADLTRRAVEARSNRGAPLAATRCGVRSRRFCPPESGC
jgi:tryptophan-rich sensory protein